MKRMFFDAAGRLRNGWWMAIFAVLFIASRAVYTPVSHALQQLGVPQDWLGPLRFAFVLGVTFVCVRLRREPLASVGLELDRRWAREFGAGLGLGIATVLLVVSMIWIAGGVRFELDPARSSGALLQGLCAFLFVALFEETLFRGFAFQRLVAGAGPWIAQIVLGLLFATGHWDNPNMGGATLAWATLELFLGAVLLGLAYLRTRSLALPVGLHLGWNWLQGHVLGFGVSGIEHAGWFHPVLLERPEWLTGGRFGLEASVFAVVVDTLTIALLWKWRGSVTSAAADETRAVAATTVAAIPR